MTRPLVLTFLLRAETKLEEILFVSAYVSLTAVKRELRQHQQRVCKLDSRESRCADRQTRAIHGCCNFRRPRRNVRARSAFSQVTCHVFCKTPVHSMTTS